MSSKASDKSHDLVKSLLKGLAVIESFNAQRQSMSLTEVAAATGFTRAAARRFLLTLVAEGYARQDAKQFSLTAKVLNLGFSYLSTLDLWDTAKPYMEQLVEQVHESCSAAVLDGFDVVYVARVPTTKRIMSITLNIGTRLPAFATSMGRILLAYMPDEQLIEFIESTPIEAFSEHTITERQALYKEIQKIRKQGWCLVDQELEIGLRSISVPVYNSHGVVEAALNVSTHISQTSKQQLVSSILPALQGCAREISRASGGHYRQQL